MVKLAAVLKARSGGDRAEALRVERQQPLQPQDRVEQQHAGEIEEQHRDRIGRPVLLGLGLDAGEAVEAALDGPKHRREERALAREDARHVAAERPDGRDDENAEEKDLSPADECHGAPQNRSGRISA